jgi:hypothetical protein
MSPEARRRRSSVGLRHASPRTRVNLGLLESRRHPERTIDCAKVFGVRPAVFRTIGWLLAAGCWLLAAGGLVAFSG